MQQTRGPRAPKMGWLSATQMRTGPVILLVDSGDVWIAGDSTRAIDRLIDVDRADKTARSESRAYGTHEHHGLAKPLSTEEFGVA